MPKQWLSKVGFIRPCAAKAAPTGGVAQTSL